MKKIKIVIDDKLANLRLDLAIALSRSDLTRSHIKKILSEGHVELNGKIEYRPQIRVNPNDEIEVEYEHVPKEEDKIIPQNIPLDIVYEDADLVVVNKPFGMVTHPATGNWEGTLLNALLYHFKSLGSVGTTLRSGLIHRLDKDTSGLVLVGKSNKGLWYYSRAFAERRVEKIYLAIITGNIDKVFINNTLVITNYIGRNPKNRKKMSLIEPSKGRLSESYIILIRKFSHPTIGNAALVEVRPKTGRTHQIRVHLSSLGCPILGDNLYGKKSANRMFLHAWKLRIKCIDNIEREFVAPIPKDFNSFNEPFNKFN